MSQANTDPTMLSGAKARKPRVSEVPSPEGRFGQFGGSYVPETLTAALRQLSDVYEQAASDRKFWDELQSLFKTFVGRPTPLYKAARLTDYARSISTKVGGAGHAATIWLKREDLAHTGAHNGFMAIAALERSGRRASYGLTNTADTGADGASWVMSLLNTALIKLDELNGS